MYPWIVFLHVIGVFGFLLAHGVSASAAFALRRERNLERIRALLDVSSSSLGVLYGALLLLLVTGIVAGFMLNWWSQGWIWLSLGLLIAIVVAMYAMGSNYYSRVRKAVGLAYMDGSKQHPPVEPANAPEIDALLAAGRPMLLVVIGFGGAAGIAWLMMFKPF